MSERTVEYVFEDSGLAVEVFSSVGRTGRKFYGMRVGWIDREKVPPAFHPSVGIFTERSENHTVKLRTDYAAVLSMLLIRAQAWVVMLLEQERIEHLAARKEYPGRGSQQGKYVMRPGKTAREREKQRAKAAAAAAKS